MQNPIISIIIPVYNVECYLEECIESVLSQTFKDFEILLVDDGSIDSSGLICDKYANDNPKIKAFHKSNEGVSSARNLGLEKVSGEWVTFIDGDDVIEEHFLEGLYDPIKGNPNIQFVHGGCKNWDRSGILGFNQKYSFYEGNDSEYLIKNFRGLIVSKLFNKNLLRDQTGKNSICFDRQMKVAEDMAFTFDYLKKIDCYAFVEESGYLYRRDNNNSATHKRFNSSYSQELYSCNNLINKYESLCAEKNLPKELFKERLCQRGDSCFRAIMYLYIERQPKKNRIFSLKNDWVGPNKIYLYFNSSIWKKNIMRLLYKEYYNLFDTICVVLTTVYQRLR